MYTISVYYMYILYVYTICVKYFCILLRRMTLTQAHLIIYINTTKYTYIYICTHIGIRPLTHDSNTAEYTELNRLNDTKVRNIDLYRHIFIDDNYVRGIPYILLSTVMCVYWYVYWYASCIHN